MGKFGWKVMYASPHWQLARDQDATPLPGGNFEITVTLPPGTGAFYAYATAMAIGEFGIAPAC